MTYDFDERQRLFQEYLNSEENKERIAPFEQLCDEYLALREQYNNSFEELNRAAEEKVVRREYAKGGEVVHRGAYFPGMLDLIIGGMNRGRLLKKPPKDNHYNYEYLFDADDRLICVKSYASDLKYRLTDIEFLIHKDDEVLSLIFERHIDDTWLIHGMSKCKYRNGLLLRYETVWFGMKENESMKISVDTSKTLADLINMSYLKIECSQIDIEEYQYTEGLVNSFCWHHYTPDLKALEENLVTFHRDEDGDLSTYTIKKIGGLKSLWAEEEEKQVYRVSSKKKKKKKDSKKIDLQAYLENRLRDILSTWDEEGIYAISFFLYANEAWEYKNYSNVTEFSVSYNTEADCDGAGEFSEERWNYAFWRQDEVPIFQADEEDEGMEVLFDWYAQQGIKNIGYEDFNSCYDDKMNYVGKGPVGYYELLSQITSVAKKLQESGFIKEQFGAPIPIIIHDLEYVPYVIEATAQANPNGEAKVFLAAMKELGITP